MGTRAARSDVEGVLLDLDGVLTTSWRPLPGAVETLCWLQGEAIPFVVLTNTTSMTRRTLRDRVGEGGLDIPADALMTAPSATAAYLREHHPGARCYLINKTDISEDLGGIDLVDEAADVVVIGGAEDRFTYGNVNRAFQMLMAGAHLVAMHRSLYWKTDQGLMIDAGAFVLGLEAAAGVTATTSGKPSQAFFDAAVRQLGVPRKRVVMVGDDLRSDVFGAQDAGIAGILVRTGKFRPEHLENRDREPDAVLPSVADLRGLLAR